MKNKEAEYANVKERIEEVGERIKDKTQELFEEGREKLASLEHSIAECEEEFINKVRERPVTSLLIAAGIGFLLSKMLK